MNEPQTEEALAFRRRFRSAIITFAVVEFIVIMCVVCYVMGWQLVK